MNDITRLNIRIGSAISVLCAVVVLSIPSFCFAQDDNNERGDRRNWDPVDFLKRLDRNGDGTLSTDEMGGRSGRFIADMGFDVSRPVVIDRVVRKIDADKETEAAAERRKGYEATRTIPGFGDEPVDLPEIPGFGLDGDSGSSGMSSVTGNFDEETENTIKAIMERYDENKDGFLAGEETRRVGRWIGSVEESDKDQDGKLSPVEIAEGFKLQMQRRRSGEESQSSREDPQNGNNDRGRGRGSDRGRMDPRGNASTDNTPSRTSAPSSSSTTRSMDGRMTAYVDGVFEKYDKNGDNKLDKDELTTVKVQFKDTDGDGNISRDEATNFVSGAQKSSGSVSPAYVAGQRGSRNRGDSNTPDNGTGNVTPGDVVMSSKTPYESSGSQSDGNRGGSGKFKELDANEDGQLQMNEFSSGKKWSDELYQEFLDADLNSDGVITAEEFGR